MDDEVVIVAAKRTAMGSMLGGLQSVPATTLGATAIKGCLEQAPIDHDLLGEVFMGCVLSAGLGQAPARQAAIGAGISTQVPCTTINKMCGSGMKAIMLAYDSILAGSNQAVIAGGLENMSRAPYLLPNARGGFRLGHKECLDHMFIDGLEDAYDDKLSMGVFAERTATEFNFSREAQDAFAITSLTRAQHATDAGVFAKEIVPVTIKCRKGETLFEIDENPQNARPDKIPLLRPAFTKEGTVTAANSSSISDGAAALTLMSRQQAEALNIQPLARIIAHASHAHAPEWFTTAPINAVEKLLRKCGWRIDDVDLFEINEAFAVVTMASMKALKLSHEKINVHGGACALGHPIGASGARIMVTLLNALTERNLKRGIASLCIGGGEATALAIERIG